MILSEFSRIMDHFVCIGTNVVDLGAITPFFVLFRAREEIYELLEACCGARLTVSYVRIGGLAAGRARRTSRPAAARLIESVRDVIDAGATSCSRATRSSPSRFKDVGVMPQGRRARPGAGWARACAARGVAYDVRKDHPYSGYEQYDFDVPVGTVGDCYDRYLVRMEEIRQSLRIIEQALAEAARRARSSSTTSRWRCRPRRRSTRTSKR